MSPHRPPPLNAVRAFEAAARHLSFSLAAAELNVTHSAVSRQVKSLEHHLGVTLFDRLVRQVKLTREGQRFFAEVQPALARINAAALAVMPAAQARSVRINVRPSFAVRWLIPRLPDFVARHPGIEPQVVTSTLAPEKAIDTYDVAIRRGLSGWPDRMEVRPFLEDEIFVVASPALLAASPIARPQDLSRHVLLSANTRRDDWAAWLAVAGVPRLKPAGRLRFDHLHFVLQAAIDSLGVALCPTTLGGHDIETGRLVSPLPGWRLPVSRYYFCVAPEADEAARVFTDWLEDIFRADTAQRQPV